MKEHNTGIRQTQAWGKEVGEALALLTLRLRLFFRLLMCKNVQEQLSTPQIPRSQRSATGLILNGAARRDRDDRDLNGKQLDMNELERLFPASLSQEQQDKGITVSPAGREHTWEMETQLRV